MTMVSCDNCQFRRPHLSVRQTVTALDVPLIDALPQTMQALDQWYSDLYDDEMAEFEAMKTTKEWKARPPAHDFCGAHHQIQPPHSVAPGVLEKLNTAGNCHNHKTGPIPHRSCSDCRFLERPPLVTSMLGSMLGGTQGAVEFAASVHSLVESRARSELLEAFKARGVLREKPYHVPTCSHFSKPGRYVIGPITNWTQACPRWEAA